MKKLALLLAVLVGAVVLALIAHRDPGYLLIAYRDWSVETSLALAVVMLLVLFALVYGLLAGLRGTAQLRRRAYEWRRARRVKRARASSNRGLIALAEGHWEAAEKYLLKHVADSDNPLFNYLSAARAAQKRHAHDARDRYLLLAHQSMPAADVAVELTQAELQLAHGQFEQALATLQHLRSMTPRHPYVLYLLMQLYERLRDWDELVALLPELRKRKVVSAEQAEQLALHAHLERLGHAGRSGERQQLMAAWDQIPRELRYQEAMVYAYARHLVGLDEPRAAEQMVRDALRRQWSSRLVQLYGLIPGPEPDAQLAQAERWLKEHPGQPALLLSAARIALRAGLWGKAQHYLESSLRAGPRPEVHYLLGRLLEQLGRPDEARAHFRDGLGAASAVLEGSVLELAPERIQRADATLDAVTPEVEGGRQSLANSKASE
ncbi:tetratricopeptide repeat protein [Ectothiorhodospiraceae bacterium 2226]|nr:tetratricopeptide repeat protein [Ectothiorhodospiraceae bacterium 2226]